MDLHVVSFNVPWPADYGGVIDVFYRCKALSAMGVRIHLHCYCYGRKPAPELEEYCVEVNYYERDCSPLNLFTKRPYIVSSRQSSELLGRLLRDDYPVLLEGLHCCWLLEQLRGADHERIILVRAHNVEHDYYSRLAKSESKRVKRPYLTMEAKKLERYEPVLLMASYVMAVTEADAAHFRSMGCDNVVVIPSSHCYENLSCEPGRGGFALYHGNLSVPENIEAARYLMEQVFVDDCYPLTLAGMNPDATLVQMAKERPWVTLVPNPDDATMNKLLREAQINVLVTAQPTGLKLKLLNSLYSGRHCLVNSDMVAGTSLGALCTVADTPQELRAAVADLFVKEFASDDVERRCNLLGETYNNACNARRLITLLKKS